MINNENKRSPDLSYTNRDYASIFNDLINSIPNLSKKWNSREEADPGIVLVKLMSMLGDMLSYNQDKQALEVYPDLVTQRKNAAQIFRLIGYKMHWYRSARCGVYITNTNSVPVTIPRYTTFTTKDKSITYTNLEQFEIPSNTLYRGEAYQSELIQGIPVTPTLKRGSYAPANYNDDWHTIYNYNVNKDEIVNNRLYFKDTSVEETSVALIDNDENYGENEWTQVENLNTAVESGKIFEFGVDENDRPYIELPSYWNTKYSISKFKLFYLISSGEAGEVLDNTLTEIDKTRVYSSYDVINRDLTEEMRVYNSISTFGHIYETPDEARRESQKYQNTIDTLVTLDDFTRAAKRITGIANAVALDCATDPRGASMKTYTVKIYAIRDDGYVEITNDGEYYEDSNSEVFKLGMITELQSYKLMPYKIVVSLEEGVEFYDWGVTGKLYLKEPVSSDKARDLLVKINNNLDYAFSPRNMEFNEAVNYVDIIDVIEQTDPIIRHVDLDPIEYYVSVRDKNGNPTGYRIDSRYLIYDKNGYTGYQITNKSNGQIIKDTGESTGYETDGCNEIIDVRGSIPAHTGYYIMPDNTIEYRQEDKDPVTTEYTVELGDRILNEDDKDTGAYIGKTTVKIGDSTVTLNQAIMDEYGEFSGYYIDENTNQIYQYVLGNVYETGYYKSITTGDIVDDHGDIIYDDIGAPQKKLVSKEAITGKYEQTYNLVPTNSDNGYYHYKIRLGCDENGDPLKDSVGDEIVGFPVKPGTVFIRVEGDTYIISDNGSGRMLNSQNILDGLGTIDYTNGVIEFDMVIKPTQPFKISYTKNCVNMARYQNLDPTSFIIPAEYIKKGQ